MDHQDMIDKIAGIQDIIANLQITAQELRDGERAGSSEPVDVERLEGAVEDAQASVSLDLSRSEGEEGGNVGLMLLVDGYPDGAFRVEARRLGEAVASGDGGANAEGKDGAANEERERESRA